MIRLGRVVVLASGGLVRASHSPRGKQDRCHGQIEHARPGQQLDPADRSGDHSRHGSGDEHQGQVATGLALLSVPVQRPGGGDHVVEQVGRGDGRAGRAQHTDLKGQQQHRAGDARGRGQHRDDIRPQGGNLGPADGDRLTTLRGGPGAGRKQAPRRSIRHAVTVTVKGEADGTDDASSCRWVWLVTGTMSTGSWSPTETR
jgi:hypothetical protein